MASEGSGGGLGSARALEGTAEIRVHNPNYYNLGVSRVVVDIFAFDGTYLGTSEG
jgi:hypothetical protein